MNNDLRGHCKSQIGHPFFVIEKLQKKIFWRLSDLITTLTYILMPLLNLMLLNLYRVRSPFLAEIKIAIEDLKISNIKW